MNQNVNVDSMSFSQAEPFDFSNCQRNLALIETGMKAPIYKSTGTTIAAAIYKDGIIMGADSRGTKGEIVADKYMLKVHKLTDSIYACGAGTGADLNKVTEMISANLRLLELNTGKKARVVTALQMAKQHLFKYQGYIGAYLLIGGLDPTGIHLFSVSAAGNSQRYPFAALGSGSYAAISVLEREYREGMTEAECRQLLTKSISHGMHGDNMSGNTMYLAVITEDGARLEGPTVPTFCNRPDAIERNYRFPQNYTQVVKKKKIPYDVIEHRVIEGERMET